MTVRRPSCTRSCTARMGAGGGVRPGGRTEGVAQRLRTDAVAADCFGVWTVFPHAGPVWNTTADALIKGVLRPVVRTLAPPGLKGVEQAVEIAGSSGRVPRVEPAEHARTARPADLGARAAGLNSRFLITCVRRVQPLAGSGCLYVSRSTAFERATAAE